VSVTAPPSGLDATTPVVILKMTTNLVQHGVLGILRSAGRWGIPVHWVHNEGAAPAARSRHLTAAHPLPPGPATGEGWAAHLGRVGRAIGGRPVLVATDDPSTALLAEHRDRLEPVFRFPMPPEGLVGSLVDKRRLHELCLETDVPTPAVSFPERSADLEKYAATGEFPVVVKRIGAPGTVDDETLPSVTVVRTPADLRALARRLPEAAVASAMLQEYIPGGARSVWMLDGYFGADSGCLAAYTGRKLRQHPTHTGMTSLGVCEHNPAVIETTERLMRRIGYRGIVDMGYRHDARDGKYKLLDVNPRIGATFRLFVDAAGTDVLRALYLDMTGQPRPVRAPVRDGRRWVVEHHDLAEAAAAIRRRDMRPGAWLASLLPVREAAWFSPADPLPAAALAVAFARRGIGRERQPAALTYQPDGA
jgi:predicted ATP-grasp superfamily ATP-dependent carboligase